MFDVCIIGCGIVGAAVAYELSRYDLSVAVIEKENDVATGSTKANSAIIHAGYDPEPGSLMARLNVEGNRLAASFCDSLDVPHMHCGALVLAFSEREAATLAQLLQRGRENGVPDLRILPRDEVLEIEPALSGEVVAALYAPTAMIVDPWQYTLALAETAVRNGCSLHLETAVTGIEPSPLGYLLQTSQGFIETRTLINAAGLYADDIHNMVAPPAFHVQPARGEYWLLDKSEGQRVSRVIFQCPSDAGKGVLVAPTVHGNLIVGPNSAPSEGRNDVSTTAQGLHFVRETARKSVPGLDFSANIRNFSGNRAATEHSDFIITEPRPGFIDLAGIKSPGLSAAPAIAKLAVSMLEKGGLALHEKQNFIDMRKKAPPSGRVVCRCETVTEGELRAALHAPIPPRSVDSVKRRCGAGMGRCQGGFCAPRVVDLLAEHYNCKPTDVLQDGRGSHILVSETKRGLCTDTI
ncbi:MAG: NAD(P)/FAD-dependent oxidoreductase [Clostridiales bacterium]|nr:NAD(P)/FAD-dependent oxidoreductase [Clostridiales bacterium]